MFNLRKQSRRLGLTLVTALALTGIGVTTGNAKSPAPHHHVKATRPVDQDKAVRQQIKATNQKIAVTKQQLSRYSQKHNHKRRTVRKARVRRVAPKKNTSKRGRTKVQTRHSKPIESKAQPASGPSKSNVSTNGGRQFNRMFKLGKSKLGTPYLLGAVGTRYFDCGSFTQYLYGKTVHKSMSRNAQVQYDEFKHVSEHRAKPGDLVFFGGSTRTIGHVGLYIGHGKMIDSQLRGVVIEHIHAPWWNAVGFARPANLK